MSVVIKKNTVVSIHYVLTDDNDEVLDDSTNSYPLVYLHGAGNLILGLEKELEGKEVGFKALITVKPEEAYGQSNPDLIQDLPISQFQGIDKIEPGMNFETQSSDGQIQRVIVRKVTEDAVTIDANHPLADMTLNFDLEVVEVREADEEEIAHGHVHGPGGHQH